MWFFFHAALLTHNLARWSKKELEPVQKKSKGEYILEHKLILNFLTHIFDKEYCLEHIMAQIFVYGRSTDLQLLFRIPYLHTLIKICLEPPASLLFHFLFNKMKLLSLCWCSVVLVYSSECSLYIIHLKLTVLESHLGTPCLVKMMSTWP